MQKTKWPSRKLKRSRARKFSVLVTKNCNRQDLVYRHFLQPILPFLGNVLQSCIVLKLLNYSTNNIYNVSPHSVAAVHSSASDPAPTRSCIFTKQNFEDEFFKFFAPTRNMVLLRTTSRILTYFKERLLCQKFGL